MQGKDRYSRQMLYAPIGESGQQRLRGASAAIVGMGALGCACAELLSRAGVGRLKLYDRDFVEPDNLQRQILYDEEDAARDLPKAKAAALRLNEINSACACEAFVTDVNAGNAMSVAAGADLVLDGSDNFETRFVLNEACFRAGKPWIYAACVEATSMGMAFIPGATPCFRCLVQQLPPPGAAATCDTAGVLNSAAMMAASFQAAEALKILSGNAQAVAKGLFCSNQWTGDFELIPFAKPLPDCPVCSQRRYEYLDGLSGVRAVVLCGRNAVQVTPSETMSVDLRSMSARLKRAGAVRCGEFLLKFSAGEIEIALFGDGRAIVKGARSLEQARALYARYIGL